MITDTTTIDIRRSDVEMPEPRAVVHVGIRDDDGVLDIQSSYSLSDEPLSDVEALTWTCGAVEIAQ